MSELLLNKLEKLSSSQLIDMLITLSQQSKENQKAINQLLLANDPKAFYKLLNKEVTSFLNSKKFYGYWDAIVLADQFRAIVNKVDTVLAEQAPDLALKIVYRIVEKEEKIANRVDDSNGEVGEVYHEFFRMADRAFAYAKSKPELVAEFIYETFKESMCSYNECVLKLTQCLTDEVLEALRRMLKPLGKLEPHHPDRFGYDHDAALHKFIADKRKDIDYYIAVCQAKKELNLDYVKIKIAKRYIDAFREADAIAYLNTVTHANFQEQKNRLLIEAYLLDGDINKVKTILKNGIFIKGCFYEKNYLEYLKYADAQEADAIKKEIMKTITDKGLSVEVIRTLHAIDELALLETLLIKYATESQSLMSLHGGDTSSIRKISTSVAKSNPLVAVLLRRIIIEDCLDRGLSKYYDYAVSDFKKSIDFGEHIADWKGVPNLAQYHDVLSLKHGKKGAFWYRVTDANLVQRIKDIYGF